MRASARPRCLPAVDRTGRGAQLAQVIVVDDAPDAPAEVPARIAGAEVDVRRNPSPIGAAACRNVALALLHPDIDVVGFLDDDVRVPRAWLSVVLAELTPARGAITGPVQRFDGGIVARARQLRYDKRYERLRPGQPVNFLAGGNAVIWRSILARAGQFPDTPTKSDTLLALRLAELGTPCHFVPELVVAHRNSKGLRQACVAAWQAGRIDGRQATTTYGRRLADGAAGVATSPDPLASALNVCLDAVFLAAHATSRARLRGVRIAPGLQRILERPGE